VIRDVGARPWDRDSVDLRILANVIEGRGAVIDSQNEVGGYPVQAEAEAKFNAEEWDLRFMTRRPAAQR
jgi:hypothetical protein